MIPLSLAELAVAVDGTVVNDVAAQDTAASVTVTGAAFLDSRRPVSGGLFVAVAGEHVDGHDYAAAAVDGGAAAVLSTSDTGRPGVLVADPVQALGRLARHVLARLPEVRVVALTGSQGKTSTKDLLAQVLAGAGSTVATLGSYNNELGLPLTVLRAGPGTEFLVLEMGARHLGDLTASCAIAPPDVSLVLNVGKAHIGEFGSQEAIAAAKGEIVDALGPEGIAVLNADDNLVAGMATRSAGAVCTFGSAPGADLRYQDVRVDALGRPSFDLATGAERVRVTLGLVGQHHAGNAAGAAAAALALGVSLPDVATSLGAATATSRSRMQVHERGDGLVLIDDAYNANPDSMQAALAALAAVARGRRGARTVAVLGEMRELGASSGAEHEAVGRLAARLGIDQIVVVGEPARGIHHGAGLEGSGGNEPVLVADNESATGWLLERLGPGDVVLFKASNAVGLSQVAERVLAQHGPATDPATQPPTTGALQTAASEELSR